MRKHLAVVGLILFFAGSALAQRFDAELHLSQLKNTTEMQQGAGGKFAYHLNKNFALEAILNFFPENNGYVTSTSSVRAGRELQGLFGLKARLIGTDRFTFSAKLRPGFVTFGKVITPYEVSQLVNLPCPPGESSCSNVQFANSIQYASSGRQTGFAFDYGGVLDVTTSKHTFLSLEFGATTVHFPEINPSIPRSAADLPSTLVSSPSAVARTTNNLQLNTGFGFRF
jgi:hypothetical protein